MEPGANPRLTAETATRLIQFRLERFQRLAGGVGLIPAQRRFDEVKLVFRVFGNQFRRLIEMRLRQLTVTNAADGRRF
jgi:hypothetical protein